MPPSTAWTLIACCLLSATILQAQDYYVSGTGNDAQNGTTTGTAFKTLQKAAGLVNPGDTVWVMAGQYTANNNVLTLTRPGTPSQWITWRAYPGHSPEIIVGPKVWRGISVDAPYQIIDGLTITGNNDNVTLADAIIDNRKLSGFDPRFNGNGIVADGRGDKIVRHHAIVRNCTIRKCGGAGIAFIYADHITIENCLTEECSWYTHWPSGGIHFLVAKAFDDAPGYHMIFRNNISRNNKSLVEWRRTDGGGDLISNYTDGNGLCIDTFDDHGDGRGDYLPRTLIANNLFVGNGGSGAHTFRSSHVDFVNNVSYMNGQVCDGTSYIYDGPDLFKKGVRVRTAGDTVKKDKYANLMCVDGEDVRFYNNIMVAKDGGITNTANSEATVVWSNNLHWNIPPDQRNGKWENSFAGTNNTYGDPSFQAPGFGPAASFLLALGSVALDAGVVVADVTPLDDLRGILRPQGGGIDRGAYEMLPVPVIGSALSLPGVVGSALTYQVTASHGASVFNATGLPDGLTIDPATGIIAGTPAVAGTRQVVLTASNRDRTGTAILTVTIMANQAPVISASASVSIPDLVLP